MDKKTPVEKVYEAWTAIADGRIKIAEGSTVSEGSATMSSSITASIMTYAGKKMDGCSIRTTTRRIGAYAGYPILAVLMMQGRLPYDEAVAGQYAGVDWKAVNTRHRNKYAEAIAEVQTERNLDREQAATAARAVSDGLEDLNISVTRKKI